MDPASVLGFAAGFLTTTSFLPQVVKTWKTRSADDISYGMIVLFLAGIALWLVYGIQIHSLPVILANAGTILLLLLLLTMKVRYEK